MSAPAEQGQGQESEHRDIGAAYEITVSRNYSSMTVLPSN